MKLEELKLDKDAWGTLLAAAQCPQRAEKGETVLPQRRA